MKKLYSSFVLLLAPFLLMGQAWEIYDAKVLPTANTPAFSSSSAGNATYYLVANPDNPKDSVFHQETFPETDKTQLWKLTYQTDNLVSLTIVARVRNVSPTTERMMEFDLDNNGKRERVFILNDNKITTYYQEKTTDIPGNVRDWHIYRIFKDADSLKVFMDEDPKPVFRNGLKSGGTNNYFRFGDGASTQTYGFELDWLIWDESGAYAPGEGAPLPEGLTVKQPGWFVYGGDVIPLFFDPKFEPSDSAGVSTKEIIDDPDNTGNKLLEMELPVAAAKYWYRHKFVNTPQKGVTLVARIKGKSASLDRTMEFDLQHAGFRERLFLKNDNTFELKESGTTGDLTVGTLGWHIYRFTKTGDSVNFYLDENPVPLATVKTTTASTSNYFRFGDGNGGSSLGGMVDWLMWDTTGAYAPGGGNYIPDTLLLYATPSNARLSSLTTDPGTLVPDFDPDILTYDIEVPFGTNAVVFTSAAEDVLASVAGDGSVAAPGTASIVVTAQDGYKKTYTVNITVTAPSTDATLSVLSFNVGTLSPTFNPATTDYGLLVPAGTNSIVITATPTHPGATVTGAGTFNLPGTASIVVTAQDGTTVITYRVVVSITVMEDLDSSMQRIYPNPAVDYVFIDGASGSRVIVHNTLGLRIMEVVPDSGHYRLNLESLNPGAYFISVENKDGIKTRKVIKK